MFQQKKTYDLFKQKYKVDRNVHIIPTGIEVERFYKENIPSSEVKELRKKLGLTTKDFVILFVGRLGTEKSVDTLIEAHYSIVKRHPEAKLIIIGDGPDADQFKELTGKLKLNNHVIFTGRVPWEEIPKYYQLATVFATASSTETQGLTVIEAMGASIPVVCLDDEAFRTVVIDDLNGYLFKDKREYRRVILDLIEEPKRLERLRTQARITADQHSSKYFAEQVLDVYKLALGNRLKEEDQTSTFFHRAKNVIKKGFYGK